MQHPNEIYAKEKDEGISKKDRCLKRFAKVMDNEFLRPMFIYKYSKERKERDFLLFTWFRDDRVEIEESFHSDGEIWHKVLSLSKQ